jgi:hypothetical protein
MRAALRPRDEAVFRMIAIDGKSPKHDSRQHFTAYREVQGLASRSRGRLI